MEPIRTNRERSANPRLGAAVTEVQTMIRERYPSATFDVAPGEDPVGLYLTTTVDVEDTGEVFEVVVARLLELRIEDELPIYVIPVRRLARVAAEMRARGDSSLVPLPV